MATVVNVPKDTRFSELGGGLSNLVGAFVSERERLEKKRRFDELRREFSEGGLSTDEFVTAALDSGLIEDEKDMVNLFLMARAEEGRNERARQELESKEREGRLERESREEIATSRSAATISAAETRAKATKEAAEISAGARERAAKISAEARKTAAATRAAATKRSDLDKAIEDVAAAEGLDLNDPAQRVKARALALQQDAAAKAAGSAPFPSDLQSVKDEVAAQGGNPDNPQHMATVRRYLKDRDRATTMLQNLYADRFGIDFASFGEAQAKNFAEAAAEAELLMSIPGGGLPAEQAAKRAFEKVGKKVEDGGAEAPGTPAIEQSQQTPTVKLSGKLPGGQEVIVPSDFIVTAADGVPVLNNVAYLQFLLDQNIVESEAQGLAVIRSLRLAQ